MDYPIKKLRETLPQADRIANGSVRVGFAFWKSSRRPVAYNCSGIDTHTGSRKSKNYLGFLVYVLIKK